MSASATQLGKTILERLDEAARISEDGPGVTRLFATPEHKGAAKLIMDWMTNAGMSARIDDIGNIVGRYEGAKENASTLMFGSHQDSVRHGGAYDGMLGVALPIACIETFHRSGIRFPFAIEVVAFGDEEGVRFQTTLLGSRALAGTFSSDTLSVTDDDGISLETALKEFGLDPGNIPSLARDPKDVLAFVEVHIEQGPVLENKKIPVGVVTAIVGSDRLKVTIKGEAGHAGTVPMHHRKDALSAASECILAIERACRLKSTEGVVGTVGMIEADPGAINVIPGKVTFSIDIRSPHLKDRAAATDEIKSAFSEISEDRGVSIQMNKIYSADGCTLSPDIMNALENAIAAEGVPPFHLPSGAGHDCIAMNDLTKTGMLFVRCKDGISHRPDEAISEIDANIAAQIICRFLREFPHA